MQVGDFNNNLCLYLGNVKKGDLILLGDSSALYPADKQAGFKLSGKHTLISKSSIDFAVQIKTDKLKKIITPKGIQDLPKVLHELDNYFTAFPPRNREDAALAWKTIEGEIQQYEAYKSRSIAQNVATITREKFWNLQGTHALKTSEKSLKQKLDKPPVKELSADLPRDKPIPVEKSEPEAIPLEEIPVEFPESSLNNLEEASNPPVELIVPKDPMTMNLQESREFLQKSADLLSSEFKTNSVLNEDQKEMLDQCFTIIWRQKNNVNNLLIGNRFPIVYSLLPVFIQAGSLEQSKFVIDSLSGALNKDIKLASDLSIRNVADFLGHALGMAIANDDLVGFILDKNPNVDVRLEDERTPLHLAVIGGHDSSIRELGKLHAKYDIKDKYGKTAPEYYQNDAGTQLS
jgi:hypothetical protein